MFAPSSPPSAREYAPLPLGWRTPPVPQRLAAASVGVAMAWCAVEVLLLAVSPGEARRRAAGFGAAAFGETLYATLVVVLLAVQVAALVIGGLWLRRAQRFALYLGPGKSPRRGGAWPWFGWVVPLACYWIPFQMVRDLRDATLDVRGGGTVGAWWATWLAAIVVENPLADAAFAVQLQTPGVFVARQVVLTVLIGFALVLWVGIIRELTRAQRARAVA